MYAYRPLSLWSLRKLLDWEILGQRPRFERFMASMTYYMAAGKHIDMDATPRFSVQVDEAFANPFEEKKKVPETAEEIKQYVLKRLEE